jgi:hypothetical protein
MLLIRGHSLLKHIRWGLALIFFMLVISSCASNRGYEIYVEKRIVEEKAAWETAINENSELAYRSYIKQFNSRQTASYGWHHPVHLRMAELSLDYWLAKASRSVKDAQMLLKDERFVYLRKNITDPDDKIQFDRINSLSNDLAMNSLVELLRNANSVFIDIKYNEKSPDMLLNQALEKKIRETVIQVVANKIGYLNPSNDANTADFTLSIYFKAKSLSSLYRLAHNSNTTRRYTGLDLFLKSHIDWQGFKRFSNHRAFTVEPIARISTSALNFYRGGDTETTRKAIAKIYSKPEDAVFSYPKLEVSNYFEKLLSEALGFAGDDDIR